jgi:hypothetical protein
MAKKGTRYSCEVRERSVRRVRESRGDHPSEWAAIRAIVSKVGCSAGTLRVCDGRRPPHVRRVRYQRVWFAPGMSETVVIESGRA